MRWVNPFKRSVRTQLIVGVALVHAVLMTFFVGDMIHKQAHILYQEVQEGTKNVVQSFAQGISMWLATGDYQAVQDALDSMTEQFSNFQTVLVMDREGRILAHNIPKYVGQFVSDSISLSVLRQDRSQARYQVLKMNDRGLDVVAPVKLNNQLVGWVRVQRKLDTLSEQQNKIIWEGVFYTLFAIVVGSLLAWWLARRLTYRLERLRQATEQVASGQWNVIVPDESDYQDELAQLSRHFAMMLKQLQAHRQQYVQERDRLVSIMTVLPEAVVEVDEQGRIIYANPMFEHLVGRSVSQLKWQPLLSLFEILDEHEEPVWLSEEDLLRENQPRKAKVVLRCKQQQQKTDMLLLQVLPLRKYGMQHLVLLFENLSASQHLLDELAWQRDHDSLTRLYNRHALERYLIDLEEKMLVDQQPRFLMQFNLDHFKQVNDISGFSVGDQVLQEVAQLLYERLGPEVFLARLGGDDFVAVIEHLDDAEAVCEQGRALIKAVEQYPFKGMGQRFVLSMTVGIVPMTADIKAEEALLKLDYTVYRAKESGEGHCRIYRETDEELLDRFEQIGWLSELKSALLHDRVELFAQPIVVLNGSKHRVAEVLVRLRTEGGDLAAPYHFLPVAERFGLMATLDLHIVKKAIAWLSAHLQVVDQLNINLSGVVLRQIETRDILLRQVSSQSEAVRQRLCFEVTETAAIHDLEGTARILERLRQLGCKVAIDDFGSGYASFNYLKNLPADSVKIDGVFVRDMHEDRVNRAMVQAITTVAHEMNLQVVAEFVETVDIARTLQGMGVEYAQGYLFSAPVPIDELEDGLWQVDLRQH